MHKDSRFVLFNLIMCKIFRTFAGGLIHGNMTLSEQQLQRQDFVDNAIHKMINELIPNEKQLDWDIERIAQVRDSISQVVAKKGICTEQEFYPFIEE